MPCSKCLKNQQNNIPYYMVEREKAPECNYELSTIMDWKEKLFCIRDNESYSSIGITRQQLNVYLGIVLSAINMNTDLCFIEKKLNTLEPVIMSIVNKGIC